MVINHAVVFAMNGGRVLLARHREGTYNGFLLPPSGKKRSCDNNILDTAAREAKEETGIDITKPRCVGVVEIFREDGKELRLFPVIAGYRGHPRESNEMTEPRLYPLDHLPVEEMWPDTDRWMPYVIAHDRHTPPFGLRLRWKRGSDGQLQWQVTRFNPDTLIRKFCALAAPPQFPVTALATGSLLAV